MPGAEVEGAIIPPLDLMGFCKSEETVLLPFLLDCFALEEAAKISQNLNVSSAERETTLEPSGERAMWSTLAVCEVKSLILVMEGYFQRVSW
jgi:hypothetical protein